MVVVRLKIPLSKEENEALTSAALADLRGPVDQARYILREDLIRRGLLDPQPQQPQIREASREAGS